LTPNNGYNISTKSSTQQSQSSCFNALEIITNNNNATQLYDVDNGNTDGALEHRKPTIIEIFDNIHIPLDHVKSHMKTYPIWQTTNDDVDVLKSRIDNVELMLESQNLISDIEANIKHCVYQIYCKLRRLQVFFYFYSLYDI